MRKFLFTAAACMVSVAVSAQQASTKTVNEICDCVKKINTRLPDKEKAAQAVNCMTEPMGKYMDQLMEEYKIKTQDPEKAAREVGGKVGQKLQKDCPEMTPYFILIASAGAEEEGTASAGINPDTLHLDSKVCQQFKAGKYVAKDMYMNRKRIENPDASAYTEVKDGFVYDYSENKKYMTKWSIRWINACEWEQVLIETTEPNLKNTFKKGDKINIKAIGSSGRTGLWVISKILGMESIMLLEKIK